MADQAGASAPQAGLVSAATAAQRDAQAALPLGESVGKVEKLLGLVFVTHTDGTRTELQAGDPIYQGDSLETGANGAIGVILADNTSFSMAENGHMVLDEMTYDPAADEGHLSFNVTTGVFTFVSGLIAKADPDAMVLHTPTATIGVRGTQVGVEVHEGKPMTVALMEESDGFVGEVIITNNGGVEVLSVANSYSAISSADAAPTTPTLFGSQGVIEHFGPSLRSLPTHGNTANDFGLSHASAPADHGGNEHPQPAGQDHADIQPASFETAGGGLPSPFGGDSGLGKIKVTEDPSVTHTNAAAGATGVATPGAVEIVVNDPASPPVTQGQSHTEQSAAPHHPPAQQPEETAAIDDRDGDDDQIADDALLGDAADDTLGDAVETVTAAVDDTVGNVVDEIFVGIPRTDPEAPSATFETGGDTIETLIAALEPAADAAEPVTEAVITPVIEEVTAPVVEDVVAPIEETVAAVVEPVIDAIEPFVEEVVAPVEETVAAVVEPVIDAVEPVVEEVVAPVEEAVAPVEETVAAVIEPVVDAVEPVVEEVVAPVEETVAAIVEPVIDVVEPVVEEVVAPVEETVAAVIEPVTDVVVPVVEEIVPPVEETVAAAVEPVTDIVEPVVEEVIAPAEETVAAVVDAVEPVVEEVVAPVEETVAAAVIEPVTEFVAPVVETVAAPVVDTVADVVGDLVGSGGGNTQGNSQTSPQDTSTPSNAPQSDPVTTVVETTTTAIDTTTGVVDATIAAVVGDGGIIDLLGAGSANDATTPPTETVATPEPEPTVPVAPVVDDHLHDGGIANLNGIVSNVAGITDWGENLVGSLTGLIGGLLGPGNGTSGNDTLVGNGFANTIDGKAGDDVISGGGGNDKLSGGAGNDVLVGGAGNDTLDGGAGNDTVDYYDATAGVTVNLTSHAASGNASVGSDSLTGIENIVGSNYSDLLTGDSGINFLQAGGGSDIVVGGGGNDIIIGGSGNDTLTGGAGNDLFVFDANSGNDRVMDLGLGDQLLLDGIQLADVKLQQDGNDTIITLRDGGSDFEVHLAGISKDTLTGYSVTESQNEHGVIISLTPTT